MFTITITPSIIGCMCNLGCIMQLALSGLIGLLPMPSIQGIHGCMCLCSCQLCAICSMYTFVHSV